MTEDSLDLIREVQVDLRIVLGWGSCDCYLSFSDRRLICSRGHS